MNKAMTLQMQLTANGSQLASTLSAGSRNVSAFANNSVSAANRIGAGFKAAYHHLNGFSMLSKLAVAAGGYSILTDALRRNLEFEKTLLDMKQTAQMTIEQAAEMRQLAIDGAADAMTLPNDMAAGMKAFSAAGMKYESIKPSIEESARAAVAFRSTVEQIANLDFDLQDKMKLDPSEIKNAHNMLLYHAKSGRYEAAPMASEAPKYLNAVSSVGIGGVAGLNFTGALTQSIMKLAPSTQPSEVSTFIEHGLAHITNDRYVKGLKKSGIDVKKYMPDGKFYGEGGVQGVMDLAAEMKSKGLENPFKLDKAGFREQYTKKFWLQLMKYHGDIEIAMNEGNAAALDDMVGRDKAEIMNSNYGKYRQMEVTRAKAEVSNGATRAVGIGASATSWAAENPATAMAAGGAAMIGARLLWKRLAGGGGGVLDKAIGAAGGGMPVMVTNWPASLGGPMKASERMSRLPGAAGGAAAGGAAGTAAAGATLAAGGTALVSGGAVASVLAMSAMQANRDKLNSMASTSLGGALAGDNAVAAAIVQAADQQTEKQYTGFEKLINSFSATIVEALGGVADRPVEVHLDSEVVASSVNKANGRAARRE